MRSCPHQRRVAARTPRAAQRGAGGGGCVWGVCVAGGVGAGGVVRVQIFPSAQQCLTVPVKRVKVTVRGCVYDVSDEECSAAQRRVRGAVGSAARSAAAPAVR